MKYKDGIAYLTVADVALKLNISVSTLRRYIRSGVFPRPSRVYFGQQSVAVFTENDIAKLKETLERLRQDG